MFLLFVYSFDVALLSMQDFNIFLFYYYIIENDIFYQKASAKYFNYFMNGEYAYYWIEVFPRCILLHIVTGIKCSTETHQPMQDVIIGIFLLFVIYEVKIEKLTHLLHIYNRNHLYKYCCRQLHWYHEIIDVKLDVCIVCFSSLFQPSSFVQCTACTMQDFEHVQSVKIWFCLSTQSHRTIHLFNYW